MKGDRHRWNERYQKKRFSTDPAEIVTRFADLAPRGRALDLAAGNGRNSRFLAAAGFVVDALDVSDVGLGPLAGADPDIHPVCIDLDRFDIPAERYSLIVNVRFLSRRLFPLIREGLAPGGLLIFQSYLETDHPAAAAPSCRDYLLRENELLHAFLPLRIIFYREAEDPTRDDHYRQASLAAFRPR